MHEASRILAKLFAYLKPLLVPGISTLELNLEAKNFITSHDAKPAFEGYRGFPATLCTSINNVANHGVPGPSQLRDGDIIGIDAGAYKDGFFADAAVTFEVGNVSPIARHLVHATRQALYAGISQALPGNRVHDISAAIQLVVKSAKFSVVRKFTGHGIGRRLHEGPQIPNFGLKGTGMLLQEGMTLAIEPIVNEGTGEVTLMPDGWTSTTKDNGLSAHFEHTIAITKDGPLILSTL